MKFKLLIYDTKTHLLINTKEVDVDGYSTALQEALKLKNKDQYVGSVNKA